MAKQIQNNLQDTCCKCGKVYLCYESPMLKNELWEELLKKAGIEEDFDDNGRWVPKYICPDCMEKELGRPLTEDDLLLTDRNRHVIWNTDFVRGRFPRHKFDLEQDDVDRMIEQFKREMGLE